jgi:phosphosulfolactate synthase
MTPDDRTTAALPGRNELESYLNGLGVPCLAAKTVPFDPGYDAHTVVSHIAQSAHLMAGLKLSMACWQIASISATRAKIDAARANAVPVVTGGANFEIAVERGTLESFLGMCEALGVDCIEAGEGFTQLIHSAKQTLAMARDHGLDVQFEIGRKNDGTFTPQRVRELVGQGREWLEAGAVRLVIEARESAQGIGLFDSRGELRKDLVDMLVDELPLEVLCFEAPTKASQFALLKHLGPEVVLSNVRLEELLRVEVFRRGLHADSYGHHQLGAWSSFDEEQVLELVGR